MKTDECMHFDIDTCVCVCVCITCTVKVNGRSSVIPASRAAAGKAALKAWGYGDDDVEEITETITSMAHDYGADSDADDFSDDEDLEQI